MPAPKPCRYAAYSHVECKCSLPSIFNQDLSELSLSKQSSKVVSVLISFMRNNKRGRQDRQRDGLQQHRLPSSTKVQSAEQPRGPTESSTYIAGPLDGGKNTDFNAKFGFHEQAWGTRTESASAKPREGPRERRIRVRDNVLLHPDEAFHHSMFFKNR